MDIVLYCNNENGQEGLARLCGIQICSEDLHIASAFVISLDEQERFRHLTSLALRLTFRLICLAYSSFLLVIIAQL